MMMMIVCLGLALLGIPVVFALGIAVSGVAILDPSVLGPIWIPKRFFEGISTFQLLAVPFFILTAELMNVSGITYRIFHVAHLLVGHMKGGLGQVNVLASMLFSGISGSAAADAAGLGRMEIQAMTKAGYEPKFAAVVTATSAALGPLIPPSIPLVVFGALAEESIGALLLGGFLPGVLLGLVLMIVVSYRARQRGYPSEPFPGLRVLGKAMVDAGPPLLVPVILIGGIMSGIFTPTETAIVAAVYALFLSAVVYRELTWDQFVQAFVTSAVLSGKILFLIGLAYPLSLALTTMQVPQHVINVALEYANSPWIFLLALNIVLLLLGLFLDTVAAMIIVVPLIIVPAHALDINMVHLGVVVVFNLMIGLITPPFGMNMFISCAVAGCSVGTFIKEAVPFYIAMILTLLLVTYLPWITLVVPDLFLGSR